MGDATQLLEDLLQNSFLFGDRCCPDTPGCDGSNTDGAHKSFLADIAEDDLVGQLCWDPGRSNDILEFRSDTFEFGPYRGVGSPASSASDTFTTTVGYQPCTSSTITPSSAEPAACSSSAAGSPHHCCSGIQPIATVVPNEEEQCQHVAVTAPANGLNGSQVVVQQQSTDHTSGGSQLWQKDEAVTVSVQPAARRKLAAAPCKSSRAARKQPCKRGRPPKTPGVFSKGYMAIKRYRERKKGLVGKIEADIIAKQEQLAALRQEHQQLLLREQVLQLAVSAQGVILGELPQLKQIMNLPAGQHNSSIIGAPSTLAGALNRGLLAADVDWPSATTADWPVVLRHSAPDLRQLQQYTQLHRVHSCSAALECYNSFVAQSDAHLAQHVSVQPLQPRHSTAVAPGAAITSAPAFPLSVVQSVLLWDPARMCAAAQLPLPVAAQQMSGGLNLVSLNLENGNYDLVSDLFWQQVAGPVALGSEQRQRLAAAWQLCTAAHERLEVQRQDVLQLLQRYAAQSAAAGDAALSSHKNGYESGLEVAAAVESYMILSRVSILAHNWCFMSLFSDLQIAQVCVACWPYYCVPHMRTIVGQMLGKQ